MAVHRKIVLSLFFLSFFFFLPLYLELILTISKSFVLDLLNHAVAEGLAQQSWFHGFVERNAAESKLHREGDFLVRMSQNTVNNFVLSVISNSTPAHLLLLDENDLKVIVFRIL